MHHFYRPRIIHWLEIKNPTNASQTDLKSYNPCHKSLKQPFVLNFLQISYIHSSHLCSHSNVPLSFPNVEPRVFWSTEMTAIPKSTLGKGEITQVFHKIRWPDEGQLSRNKGFCSWQKIVGLQIFSMPFLKFGDIWENFGRWKKLFTLEMASCWQIFFAKQMKFCIVQTGP